MVGFESTRRCAIWLVAIAVAGSAARPARADPKREVPDYDGRGNEDQNAGSWALWIPRIVLSPFYLVEEFVIRRPVGALFSLAERKRWVASVTGFFTFGTEGKDLLVPTVLFDFGLLPSVGFYYAADDMFTPGNTWRLSAATWGPAWITATAVDKYTWNDGGTSLGVRADFRREADLLYFGTGPDVTSATQSRYGIQRFDTSLGFKQRLEGESSVALTGGVRDINYRPGSCCGDPSLDARIADGTLAVPPGYNTPYTSLYERAELALDTREPRPASATGGYLQVHEETSFDVRNDRRWLKLGGVVGLAIDLNSRQRTVKFQVGVDYADPLKGGVVPFNELASLGGDLMPGFIAGWMTGRSTVAAQAAYVWPVWVWLDAQTRFSVGNAFGGHLDGFETKKLRLSGDIGVTTVGKRDQGFEVMFGLGTETLEQGAKITSVRISFGSRKGF